VSVYPDQASTADRLLAVADSDMNRTKKTRSQATTRI